MRREWNVSSHSCHNQRSCAKKAPEAVEEKGKGHQMPKVLQQRLVQWHLLHKPQLQRQPRTHSRESSQD